MNRRTYSVLACMFGLFVAVACGESDNPSAPPATGGGAGTGGSAGTGGAAGTDGGAGTGGTAGSSNTGGAAGTAGAAGAAGTAGAGGDVNTAPLLVSAAQYDNTLHLSMWQAAALMMLQSDPSKRCYTHDEGSCTIINCRPTQDASDDVEWTSAGPITYSSTGTSDVVITPDASGVYETKTGLTGGTPKWAAGATVTMSAPGDAAPAFNVQVTIPTPLEVLTPDLAIDAGNVPVAKDQAFQMTWTPTDSVVTLELLESPTGAVSSTAVDFLDIWCRFPGADGHGEIPADLVSEFDGGMAVSLMCASHIDRVVQSLGTRDLIAVGGNDICRNVTFE